MIGIQHYETFLIAGILLNLTPGNDTIYILSRTVAQGRKAGIMSVLGIATGSLVHTFFAAVGLSLIIAKSPVLFNIIKYAGAAYLFYIGIRMIFSRSSILSLRDPGNEKYHKIYWQAVITNVLNPKVALFFISFLPQFIDPTYPNHYLSFIVLGLSFTATGTLWCLILALFASFISASLIKNSRTGNYITKACGFVLVGLGIKVALVK
ncbi:MAG TPA: LysE family translocator [Chitinophagaceae bacterium]|nr:LysE family translocator [Chitinophagaceae bacterium]